MPFNNLGLGLGLGRGKRRVADGDLAWVMDGALIDLDFENGRYYMDGTARDLSDILTGDPITVIEGQGLDERASFGEVIHENPSRGVGTAEVIAILQANLATGFTVFMDHTDELDVDTAQGHEFFGLYDVADPETADTGDAIELWFKNDAGTLGIDDWVGYGDMHATVNAQIEAGRNKSAVGLNIPLGGGLFKHPVCLNGGTVVDNEEELDYSTDHFSGPVQAASFGFIASAGIVLRGTVHRMAILLPRSNAQMQAITS